MKIKENVSLILEYMNELYKDARCELNYQKDYELLIATVLSAQCTDRRVNMVTHELWKKYDLESLAKANVKDVEKMIHSIGSYTKKSRYIISIANHLVKEKNGVVPNDREYLESLPGVGRKTCNVVLANIYDAPVIAVDTHVERVSKRLSIASKNDSVLTVEKKLMKVFPENTLNKLHHQLVLFGRYKCRAIKPECETCKLKSICKYYKSHLKKK